MTRKRVKRLRKGGPGSAWVREIVSVQKTGLWLRPPSVRVRLMAAVLAGAIKAQAAETEGAAQLPAGAVIGLLPPNGLPKVALRNARFDIVLQPLTE